MILRFVTKETPRQYVAINTKYETYTCDRNVVLKGEMIQISEQAYKRILDELDFNCWNYTFNNDICDPPDPDEAELGRPDDDELTF